MAKTAAPSAPKMVAKKAAPAPAATAPAAKKKVKTESAPKTERSARYVGVTTGLSVTEFQNKTLAANFRAKLTDVALAKSWRDEFPRAVPYTEDHVAGVRNVWNKGKHPNNPVPPRPLHPYAVDGSELPLWGEKTKAAAKKSAAPAKNVVGKPGLKVVKKAKAAPVVENEEEEEEEA